MGLYLRKKTYWFSIRHDGKRLQISTGTGNKKLAERIYAKTLTDVHEGKWFEVAEARRHTFDDMMQKYLKEHSEVYKAASTQARDKTLLKRLSGHFKGLTLDKITSSQISQYRTCRLSEGAAQATVRNELRLLGHACGLAFRQWGWLKENPVAKIRLDLKPKSIDRWLTTEEENRLLKAAECLLSRQLKKIILIALCTGMRKQEILDLRWNDVELLRRTLTVMKSKNKERRTIPLNETMVGMLKEMSKVVPLSGFVFVTSCGTQIMPRNLNRAFHTALDKADIKGFRFHDLRHTFATRLVQAGVDLYAVARLLGHKDVSTTQRYAHHYPESLRSYVNILDRKEMATNVLHSDGIIVLNL